LRIIAGSLRGRRLIVPPRGVRPTADRVRESVFARLGDLRGARVLDLFAGSGALGIESISRGASSLVSVERSAPALGILRQNLESLGIADRARLLRADVRRALRRLRSEGALFDLVFLDPPYAESELLENALSDLAERPLLAEAAVGVAERAKRHSLAPIRGLRVDDERSYGDTVISWISATRELDSDAGGAPASCPN